MAIEKKVRLKYEGEVVVNDYPLKKFIYSEKRQCFWNKYLPTDYVFPIEMLLKSDHPLNDLLQRHIIRNENFAGQLDRWAK